MAKLLAFPKPTPRAELRLEERKARMERLREIRIKAMERAKGQCEAPDCHNRTLDLQMDHWLGGSGRRREEEALDTVWMLCAKCHAARTCNVPSVSAWNALWRVHCKRYGYEVAGHREKP